MSYQSDINDAIRASAALTALIGDRFFWDVADPDAAVPYLVAQTVSGSGETLHDGTRELGAPLVQFTAWSRGKADAINLMQIFKSEMEGRELPGASTTSLVYSNEQSTRDPLTRLYGEIIDYRAQLSIP